MKVVKLFKYLSMSPSHPKSFNLGIEMEYILGQCEECKTHLP